jgi:hypothetical protein
MCPLSKRNFVMAVEPRGEGDLCRGDGEAAVTDARSPLLQPPPDLAGRRGAFFRIRQLDLFALCISRSPGSAGSNRITPWQPSSVNRRKERVAVGMPRHLRPVLCSRRQGPGRDSDPRLGPRHFLFDAFSAAMKAVSACSSSSKVARPNSPLDCSQNGRSVRQGSSGCWSVLSAPSSKSAVNAGDLYTQGGE